MGCTDSQLASTEAKQQIASKPKAIRFAPEVEDDTVPEPEQEVQKVRKSKGNSKSKSKSKQKEGETLGSDKEEKENTVKVRKARNLRHHPEHQKFIDDILQQSRAKITAEFPQIPKSSSGFIKPVVEYTPTPKGQILPNQSKLKQRNRWNAPISQADYSRGQHLEFNNSYVSVNESAKSPYKQKQIEKRLNDIRNGRFEQSQSGLLAKYRAAPFQEMECTQLQ